VHDYQLRISKWVRLDGAVSPESTLSTLRDRILDEFYVRKLYQWGIMNDEQIDRLALELHIRVQAVLERLKTDRKAQYLELKREFEREEI
jgi:hypothetical protein